MDFENVSIVRLLVYCASSATGIWMLSIMKLYHKNKPLGMQTFLGQVVVLYLNILLAIGIAATIMSMWLEVTQVGEQTATLLTVSGKIVIDNSSGLYSVIIKLSFSILHGHDMDQCNSHCSND